MNAATQMNLQAIAIALIRVVLGGVMMAHGLQKVLVYGISEVAKGMAQLGLPLPMVSAILATTAEAVGGGLLVLGLFTRWAALPVAFTMAVAWATAHRSAFFLPKGGEYVIVLFAASVAILLAGSGALALDHLRWRRRRDAAGEMPVVTSA